LTFLLTTRPTPTPTLFPYTTLFRSSPQSDSSCVNPLRSRRTFPATNCLLVEWRQTSVGVTVCTASANHAYALTGAASVPNESRRSEEHTSELQSLRHLVCRLLLEKK